MYQGIEVRFIGPTNFRGSRWKAVTASGHSLTQSQDYALSPEENATEAARLLAVKLGWSGVWFGGTTRNGYVFVAITRKPGQPLTPGAAFHVGQVK